MQTGMIGLGRMGANMTRRLLRDGHQVIAYDLQPEAVADMAREGALPAHSLAELVDQLTPPRVCWLMLPAARVDAQVEQLAPLLAPGDTVVDGGNSHYRDDLRRAARLLEGGIEYVDVGVSGGVWGLERGYCQMIARSAAVAHVTYSPEVRHPVEVGADQEAHLVAWLSKRLGAPVRAPALDVVGFSLIGGRLLPGDGDPAAGTDPAPVAQFMYQSAKGQRITLYVRTESGDHGETAFRFAREGRVRVFYWIDRNFGYALSTADLNRRELLRVATLVYKQLNP